jgi:hypothetical protein
MSRSDFLSSTSASGGTEPLDRLIQHALRHYEPVALPANFASEVASLVIDAERKDRRETLFLLGALIVAVLASLWFDSSWLDELVAVGETLDQLGGSHSFALAVVALVSAWGVDQWLTRRTNPIGW